MIWVGSGLRYTQAGRGKVGVKLWRPQLRDPADELVLEAAVNAGADALLSFNVRHFQRAVGRFGLRLSRPGPFLQDFLRGKPS